MSKKILKEYYRSGAEYEFFPGLKTKEETYLDKVKSNILQIFLDLNNIGEKSFQGIKDAKKRFDSWCEDHPDELDATISLFENKGLRKEFCAEYCFYKFFNDNDLSIGKAESLTEKRKSSLEILKKNKIPLTDEERSEVIKGKATWNHGKNGQPSPAVWKSKNSKGEVVYVTNTHRAYATASTLKGAINKYHTQIKQTS